jgi:hypothetical protein
MGKALIDWSYSPLNGIAICVDRDEVIDIRGIQSPSLAMNVPEDQDPVRPWDPGAYVALGERPQATHRDDAVNLRQSFLQ